MPGGLGRMASKWRTDGVFWTCALKKWGQVFTRVGLLVNLYSVAERTFDRRVSKANKIICNGVSTVDTKLIPLKCKVTRKIKFVLKGRFRQFKYFRKVSPPYAERFFQLR